LLLLLLLLLLSSRCCSLPAPDASLHSVDWPGTLTSFFWRLHNDVN